MDEKVMKRLRKPGKIAKEDIELSNWVITTPGLNKDSNPCIQEQNLVSKCMWKNDCVRIKCEDAFQNYRDCSAFWRKIKIKRLIAGLPPLPPPEERKIIKKEYFEEMERKKWEAIEQSKRDFKKFMGIKDDENEDNVKV